MRSRLKCMFDSNIFDKLVERPDLVESITGCVDVIATHVQRDEIDQTPVPDTKAQLRRIFGDLVSNESHVRGEGLVATESAVWNISKWNSSKWSRGDGMLEQLRGSIRPDAKRYVNRTRDALIGETAIKNGFVLITEDVPFRRKVRSLGGISMSWEQLKQHCSDPAHNLALPASGN